MDCTSVYTIGPSGVRALPLAAGINEGGHYFGPSVVRALPLAAGINEGGHYFGPSVVRALPLAAGINEGGHYFAYIILFFLFLVLPLLFKTIEGVVVGFQIFAWAPKKK
jgi:hypothetical protein